MGWHRPKGALTLSGPDILRATLSISCYPVNPPTFIN